jgi:predicted transcriptional regulator
MVVKFSTIFEEDSIKKLKHLAVDADESLGILLEEAIQDILKKNERRLKK